LQIAIAAFGIKSSKQLTMKMQQINRTRDIQCSTNLSDDGCKDEDTEHEVDNDKCVLGVSDRQRKVSDGRHCQRRPEECVEIHATECGVDRIQHGINAVVDEHIRAEADPRTEQDEEAGIPVDDDQDVYDEVDDADCVRETALCLNPFKKLRRHKCLTHLNGGKLLLLETRDVRIDMVCGRSSKHKPIYIGLRRSIVACWDVANFCPLVVFVASVRSRCPCSGVWLLLSPKADTHFTIPRSEEG